MDTPETLAAAMLEAAAKVVAGATGIVEKGALNVKTQAKANVLRSAPIHNAHAHQAITYDKPSPGKTISSEIGYDKDKPGGSLGNLLEYGGGGDHSPPHRDLGRALDDEAPRFEDFLTRMAEGLL